MDIKCYMNTLCCGMPPTMVAPAENAPYKIDRNKYGDFANPLKPVVISSLAFAAIGVSSYYLDLSWMNALRVSGCNEFIKPECANLSPLNSTSVPDLFSECAQLSSWNYELKNYNIMVLAAGFFLTALGAFAQRRMNRTAPPKFHKVEKTALENPKQLETVVEEQLKDYKKNRTQKKMFLCAFTVCTVVFAAFQITDAFADKYNHAGVCRKVCNLVTDMAQACQEWKKSCPNECYDSKLKPRIIANIVAFIAKVAPFSFAVYNMGKPYFQSKGKEAAEAAYKEGQGVESKVEVKQASSMPANDSDKKIVFCEVDAGSPRKIPRNASNSSMGSSLLEMVKIGN